MTEIFRPKRINVPGLLSDDAIQEQLKQFASEKNITQAAAPMPSGAVEAVDTIQKEYLDIPAKALRRAATLPLGPLAPLAQGVMNTGEKASVDPDLAAQNQAMEVRSDILTEAVDAVTPDAIGNVGTLSPEERQAEADKRAVDAATTETAMRDKAAIRAKLREQAANDPSSLSFMEQVEAADTAQTAENILQDARVVDAAKGKAETAKKAVTQKDLQPTQTWWMNMVQRGVAGGAHTVLDSVAGATIGLHELFQGRVFNGGDMERSDMRAWVRTADMFVDKILPGDKARSQDFLTQLAEGGGSMAAYWLGGAILRAAGMPAGYATGAMGASGQAAQQYEDAEKFNAVGLQKYLAFALGGAIGVTEMIPIDRMFRRADMATGGLVTRMFQNTKASSMEEFIQELGQSVGTDVVAKWVYDEKRELDPVKYLKSAVIGGITGGVAGAASALLSASPAVNSQVNVDPKVIAALEALSPEAQSTMLKQAVDDAQAVIDDLAPEAVDVLPSEQAAISQPSKVVNGPGGTIPVREDGLVELNHYSGKRLDVIDPAMRGTGPMRGQEQARIGKKSLGDQPAGNIVDRSYFGVGDPFFMEKWLAEQAALPKKERADHPPRTAPYRNEGLGNARHTVAVDPATIYNWYEDPMGLRDQLDKTTPPLEQVTHYEKLIKDAGFKGAYYSEGDLGQTAILFDKAEPESVTNDIMGLDPKDIASIDDFKQLSPETFKKGGWSVITGIQEAQGEHNSPANIEANKKLENVLRANGIKYQVVSGAYKGVDQGKSFLIFASEKRARELGKRFNQESVLTRDGLLYTDGRITPVDPAGTIIGPEAANQDFYSTLPDGTPFTLGLDFDATYNPADLQAAYGLTPAEPVEGTITRGGTKLDFIAYEEGASDSDSRPHFVVVEVETPVGERGRGQARAAMQELIARADSEGKIVKLMALAGDESTDTDKLVDFYSSLGFEKTGTDEDGVLMDYVPDSFYEDGFNTEDVMGMRAALPASSTLNTPRVPTLAEMKRLARVEAAPLDRVRGTNALQWGRFDAGDHPGALIEGYGDKPVAARRENGELILFDGHHRAATAIAEGRNAMSMYVIDAQAYDPENAGRATRGEPSDEELLAALDADIYAMVAKPSRVDKLMDQVPGLKRVAKHMLPDERAKLFKGNASRIVSVFENLPDPSEIATVAFAGRAKKGWYQKSAEALVDIFGIEDAPRFAALLAALSPQTSVESNAITALKVWTAWIRVGRPVQANRIKQLLAMNVQGEGGDNSVLPAWIPNSITALSHPDPSTVVLSGPKVDSFMQNLRGVTNAVTNDAWMANYVNIDQEVFKKSGDAKPGKGPGYVAFAARVRAAAAIATKRTSVEWTPAEIQETVWSWAKTLTEMAASKDEQRTAAQIAEQGGLTAEQISATPDFASLFVSGVYAQILKEGGYNVDSSTGSSGRSDGGDGRGGDPASAEGSGISQSAYDTHIRRAAKRLDALLARRAADEATNKKLGKTKRTKKGEQPAEELDYSTMDQPADYDPLAHLSEDDLKFIDEGGLFGQRSAPGPLPDVDLLASSERAAYKGELERPAQGIPMKPGDENVDAEAASSYRIAVNFKKLINLTARLGRFTLKGSDVMGQYSTKQDVARVRSMDDVDTLVHEGGHALQAAAGKPLTDFINSHVQELHKVADDLYGGDLSNKSGAEKVAEGFAEFFRVFVLGRATAKKRYPQLFADLNDVLAKDAPELHRGLEAISIQHEAWAFELPSAKLVEGMIATSQKTGVLNEALADIKEGGFGTWMHEVTRKAMERNVNRTAPLMGLVTKMLNHYEQKTGKALDLKRAFDPRVLLRLVGNSASRAHVQATDGVIKYNSTDTVTRGLSDALALSQGLKAGATVWKIDEARQKAFAAYVAALRGIDEFRRKGEGKITKHPLGRKIKLTDLQQTVKDYDALYGPGFAEAASIMHEYSMALWTKVYDAGLMSKETYDAGRDRRFYVPLHRDMTDVQNNPSGGISSKGGRSIVKKFEGSGRKIIDPLEILQHKTFAIEKAIAENEVARAIAVLADRVGTVGALAERIPANQLVGMSYSVEEIAKALAKDKSLSANDAHDMMEILDQSIADNNLLNLYRSELAKSKGENIIFFWEKGKVAALQLMDGDLGADVVQLMNGLGPENFHFLIEMVSTTSSLFRASITSWPDFLAVNFIRDQWNAYSLTDVGYVPFVTGLQGVRDELRQRDWAKQYNAAMGVMGGMNVASMHEALVDRKLKALGARGYLTKAFSGGFAGMAKGIASVVEVTETGTRLGVFKKAYQRGKKDGLSDWEASIEASYIATDMMDFGLNGSRMTMFRRTIPFLNAQVQGLYKLVRTLGGDEVRQRKGLAYVLKAYTKNINGLELSRAEKSVLKTGRKAWIKMAGLAMLSAALHFIFEDDPDYQEAGEYLRATGWVIPMGDGRIFYVPKPFELALLANFTERALEAAGGDGEAKSRMLRGLAMNLSPPTSPPAIKVAFEEMVNKDMFAGREIVPRYEQGLAPEMQYDEYTTDLAKSIGEITGLSPRRVDHVMSGLGASAYRDISTMINGLNPDRPTMDVTELPFFRRFVRDVRRGSASSKDFWKQAAAMSGLYDGAANTYKKLIETKPDDREARAYLSTLDDDMRAFTLLNTHFEADAKRFHPYYRGRQVTGIVSEMRREMVGAGGVEDTTAVDAEPIQLSATTKGKLDDELSEFSRREMRNALIYMKAPGWADKAPMSMDETLGVIEAIDPRVAEELSRRIAKKKVIPSDVIAGYWPEVKDRLLSEGADAVLDDILLVGKLSQ